jgi:hypothetical protein
MRTNHASIGWYADDGTFVASHNNGAGRAVYYLLRTRRDVPGEAAIRPQLRVPRLRGMQPRIEAAHGSFQALGPVCGLAPGRNMLHRLARYLRRK